MRAYMIKVVNMKKSKDIKKDLAEEVDLLDTMHALTG